MPSDESRARKYLLTINNPQSSGYTHDQIKLILGQLKSCVYWCMSDEVENAEGGEA